MNVLIVGLGSIGRRHARTLRTLQKDVAIYALRSGKGQGPEEGVQDVHDLSELPGKIDLVIVSSPTDLHLEHVRRILPLHPFLFLEKPLALTVAEGRTIIDAVEKAGIGHYIGCPLRFHPVLQALRAELQAHPRLVASVHATCRSWLPDWQLGRDYRESFRASADRSGGVHLELIHELDYLLWIFGVPDTRTVELCHIPELAISAPAEAHYELSYPGFTAMIDLSYASHEQERHLDVRFADGTTRTLDLLLPPAALDEVYATQMRHVLHCIAGAVSSLHPVREALSTLMIALP